jgi:hypothetical protein
MIEQQNNLKVFESIIELGLDSSQGNPTYNSYYAIKRGNH